MPKFRILFFSFLAFSSILTGCGNPQPKEPIVVPDRPTVADQPTAIPSFSGSRAFADLERQVSFGPRNPGSAGHAQCLNYLASELRSLADTVWTQDFVSIGYGHETLRLTNIVASFRPEEKGRILLCAHWDTRPRADNDPTSANQSKPIPGANDGASGVAVLLEIARLMHSTPPRVGVDLVLFDGEDYGYEGDTPRYLLGSRYFAANTKFQQSPRFAILLDMVGDANLEILKEQHSVRYAGDIVNIIWSTAKQLGYYQFVDAAGESITDDHLPLNEAGIKTVDLIDFDYPDHTNRYWHTLDDVPAHCSSESLEAVGAVLTHLLYTQKP